MDARDRLRRYLEQRRELGETEFVLDALPVEQALRVLGIRGELPAVPGARDEPPGPSAVREAAERAGASGDWRAALRSIGADQPGSTVPRRDLPRPLPPVAPVAPVAPAGSTAPVEPLTPVAPSAGSTAPPPVGRNAFYPAAESTGASPAPLKPGIVIGAPMGDLLGGPLDHLDSIEAVATAVAACTACSLHRGAKHPVPGEGNPHAGFVCVGEAPGATEDETGRPFVGQAGQLLTKILEAIHFRREDVFICNVLKHRPPGNRNPAPEEVRACSPFLMRQLELLKPRVILALGGIAAQTLLQTSQPIGKLRGLVHRFYGVPLIVTYHPAALLRNPAWKRPTWEDVQFARRVFDSAARGA